MAEAQDLNEGDLLPRLRAGDEAAFAVLVDRLHGRLLALARTFTSSPALAEDVVQETWIGVIRGLPAFEGRSALRTWIYSILVRRARTLATREARRPEVPFEQAGGAEAAEAEWSPGKGSQGLWTGGRPVPWELDDPAAIVQARETAAVVRSALETLPESQKQAVLLRDVEDLPSEDVCNILGVSETNLRVLLHRGRSRIRRALDRHLRGESSGRPAAGAPDARRSGGRAKSSPGDENRESGEN